MTGAKEVHISLRFDVLLLKFDGQCIAINNAQWTY